MSNDKALKLLKQALQIGDKTALIREAIKELEEDEITEADIAVLGVSSVVFSLAKRIDDLESWRAKIEGNICNGCLENVP